MYFYTVKVIALVLSVIVLTLTAMPCCPLGDSEHHSLGTTQKEKHGCDEQSDDRCMECSPFYVCGNYIGFTISKQLAVTFIIPVKWVKHNTAYIPVQLPLIPLPIWQPPKLS